jgi:HK97 family phage major capsid protein/HK97 family phage prohead protease
MKKTLIQQNNLSYSTIQIETREVNVDERLITLSFSSETPVERGFGYEILSHDPGAIILDRINTQAPLLLNHDTEKQIGVIEKAWLAEDRKCRAIVRFGSSPLAEEIYRDVQEGIRRLVSVGYLVHEVVKVGRQDGVDVYKVVKWEPLEISIVPIPADITVGVGRSLTITTREEKNMEDTINVTEAIKAEQKRVDEILTLAREFKAVEGIDEKAQKAIRNAMPVDEFRKELLQDLKKVNPISVANTDSNIGLSRKETERYSITRAIAAAVEGKWDRAPFEYEVSKEVEKRFGRPAKGFYIPMDILRRDVTYDTEKADVVSTQLQASSFIEALYKKLVLRQAGAQFIEGIVGVVEFPRLATGSTVYWQTAENTAVNESTPTFDKVTLSPKSMGAIVDVSKLLLNQNSVSVDAVILDDIARRVAVGIDTAALVGTGTNGQPSGVITIAAEGDLADDDKIDYADVVNLETVVSLADADIGQLAYITNPTVRGSLKTTLIAENSPMVVWQNGPAGVGMVNGYNAYVTSVLDGKKIFFGNWADLLIGIFAPGLDVTVDPYTGAKNRIVSLICYLDVDCGVRHAGSFALADGDKV